MMLKRKSGQSKRSAWTLLRAGVAGLGVALGGAESACNSERVFGGGVGRG